MGKYINSLLNLKTIITVGTLSATTLGYVFDVFTCNEACQVEKQQELRQEQQKQAQFDARMPEVINVLKSDVCQDELKPCLGAINDVIVDITGTEGIDFADDYNGQYTGKLLRAADNTVFQQVDTTIVVHEQRDLAIPISENSRLIGKEVLINYYREDRGEATYEVIPMPQAPATPVPVVTQRPNTPALPAPVAQTQPPIETIEPGTSTKVGYVSGDKKTELQVTETPGKPTTARIRVDGTIADFEGPNPENGTKGSIKLPNYGTTINFPNR